MCIDLSIHVHVVKVEYVIVLSLSLVLTAFYVLVPVKPTITVIVLKSLCHQKNGYVCNT